MIVAAAAALAAIAVAASISRRQHGRPHCCSQQHGMRRG